MGTELAIIEPIQAPDPRRPAMLPSLPQWAARLSGAARIELQITPDEKTFQDVMTLPADLMPTAEQRQAMTSHQDSLRSFLLDTPDRSVQAETRVATAVAKLITVLAGERKSDLADEARSEVYMDVLDDVPCWAVEAAVRRWFKHDCGSDERGKSHDYKWAPDPGTLRKIAQQEIYGISARIGQIQRVLEARPYVDCTAQVERGRAAMAGLNIARKKGLDYGKLTFDQAIELAQQPEQAEPAAAPTSEAAE
jgi:hypothetical protein